MVSLDDGFVGLCGGGFSVYFFLVGFFLKICGVLGLHDELRFYGTLGFPGLLNFGSSCVEMQVKCPLEMGAENGGLWRKGARVFKSFVDGNCDFVS